MWLWMVDCSVAYWQIIVHYHRIREIVQNACLDGSSMLRKTSACHSITVGVKEILIGLRLRRHVKLIALPKWVSFVRCCCSILNVSVWSGAEYYPIYVLTNWKTFCFCACNIYLTVAKNNELIQLCETINK